MQEKSLFAGQIPSMQKEWAMKRPSEMKREFSENDTAPLYAGVKQMILGRIHSGEWPPKHRVPSENELVVGSVSAK